MTLALNVTDITSITFNKCLLVNTLTLFLVFFGAVEGVAAGENAFHEPEIKKQPALMDAIRFPFTLVRNIADSLSAKELPVPVPVNVQITREALFFSGMEIRW